MSIFSEMALEAHEYSRAKARQSVTEPRTAVTVESRPVDRPEPKRAERAPVHKEAPKSVPDAPRSDDAARQAHEAAEAKRKGEWEMQQNKKKEAERAQLDRIAAMSDQDAADFSVRRVSADTERLTRRNMKDCVSEHIQGICREKSDFARLVLQPRKTMAHCFQYIYRKAREFAMEEMKALGDEPDNDVYALDIPDGQCYQWAEEYFKDPDAPEDKEDGDKFVPRPFVGAAKTTAKKATEKKPAKPKGAIEGQISLTMQDGQS